MADIASPYPTSPVFNTVGFTVNTPTIATETFSGKTRRVGFGHQFYSWQAQYSTLTDLDAGIVEGFLAQTYGSLLSFEIVLPKISYSKSTNPPSTTPISGLSFNIFLRSKCKSSCSATYKPASV